MPVSVSNFNDEFELESVPEECPHCHKAIIPEALHICVQGTLADVFFKCPHDDCQKTFIGHFKKTSDGEFYFSGTTSKGKMKQKAFADIINAISPSFVNVYSESDIAEHHGLIEISGGGYRKALEFLMKDYAIKCAPNEQQDILNSSLKACIDLYIDSAEIKDLANNASWLANVENDYQMQWKGSPLEEVKALIEYTVNWILMRENKN